MLYSVVFLTIFVAVTIPAYDTSFVSPFELVLDSDATGTFTVTAEAPNNPPQISSIPDATVTAGDTFTYNVQASDSDDDTLVYSLVNPPPGASMNSTTGEITWPTWAIQVMSLYPSAMNSTTDEITWPTDAGDVGTATFIVKVSDGEDSDYTTFIVTVNAANTPPQLSSIADTAITAGDTYTHTADQFICDDTACYFIYNDPVSEPIIFPTNATINSSIGIIMWYKVRQLWNLGTNSNSSAEKLGTT